MAGINAKPKTRCKNGLVIGAAKVGVKRKTQISQADFGGA